MGRSTSADGPNSAQIHGPADVGSDVFQNFCLDNIPGQCAGQFLASVPEGCMYVYWVLQYVVE